MYSVKLEVSLGRQGVHSVSFQISGVVLDCAVQERSGCTGVSPEKGQRGG